MNKAQRNTLLKKVRAFAKARGTICVNQVARHFDVKWETAKRLILKLVEEKVLFYHPEMGENPKFYSIWGDYASERSSDHSQTVKTRIGGEESHDIYARNFPFPESTVRGQPGQVVEKQGFIASPSARGSDLPRTFIRGHLHGQYFVEVKTIGKMPETYRVPGTEITGGWRMRKMNGNDCYYGEIRFPEDRTPFRFHAMTSKTGGIRGMSVYVHPRFIYYRGNAETASVEFRNQVKDILTVLEGYGWSFGAITQKGTYSMAINDRILASHVPAVHNQSTDDDLLFDSSVGSAGGVCTEAEVIGAEHEDDAALMVELPSRFRNLERSVGAIESLLHRSIPAQESLTRTVSDLLRATEFNTAILMGTAMDRQTIDVDYQPRKSAQEDVMYGR